MKKMEKNDFCSEGFIIEEARNESNSALNYDDFLFQIMKILKILIKRFSENVFFRESQALSLFVDFVAVWSGTLHVRWKTFDFLQDGNGNEFLECDA